MDVGTHEGNVILSGNKSSHVDPYEGCFVDSEVKARVTI